MTGSDRAPSVRHAPGCRTNGGALPPSKCPKCSGSIRDEYEQLLAELDRLAPGR